MAVLHSKDYDLNTLGDVLDMIGAKWHPTPEHSEARKEGKTWRCWKAAPLDGLYGGWEYRTDQEMAAQGLAQVCGLPDAVKTTMRRIVDPTDPNLWVDIATVTNGRV